MTTQPVPPTKVPQADGTIQLVPVPPGFVYTPYFIDPSVQYQLYLTSQWTNKSWNGGNKNGIIALKGQVITVDIMAMPYTTKKTLPAPDNRTINMFSIYRGADAVIQYDHTRLELLPLAASGFGFDPNVMDASKTKCTVLGDGLILYHAETLKAPELRTPALKPQYYQWNFDGYMWQGGYRLLGKLQFRVKDDYYLPTWGQQRSFVRLVPSATVSGVEYKTTVDGSPTAGTNVLKDIRTEAEEIMFGVPAEYTVSHYLTAPTTVFKAGDNVKVQIRVKPDTKPQLLSSVATNFIWNPNILEFMGVDKTGGLPSMENGISMPGAGRINESAIPKDGTAWHNWLSQLGDRRYLDKDSLICTLNFKVLADFDSTQIEIAKKNDPRLAGTGVLEESSVIGSSVPGSYILGQQNGVTINGTLGGVNA